MKTMKTMTTLLVALLIVGLLPAAAIAQDERAEAEGVELVIENLKERASEAIGTRLETIERVTEALAQAEHLDSAHEALLLDELSVSASGLTALALEIESAATLAELWELIPKIFEDYRIYLVVVPKAHLVVVADTIGAAVDRIEIVAGSLEGAVERMREAGFDVSEAETALAEMEVSLDEAARFARSAPDAVLPLTPGDWPDPAQSILEGSHADLRLARDQVASAIRSAHLVGRILRELLSP